MNPDRVWAIIALAVAALLSMCVASRAETLPGPVAAQVLRVIDGDTVEVRAMIWLGQTVTEPLRIDGMDAPESGSKAKCDRERNDARVAMVALKALVAGKEVMLYRIRRDKYGRLLARVVVVDGPDVADHMIVNRYARPYAGGQRQGWCG